MANGMPISALCGKEDYMRRLAPPQNIFFSLTFGGEALSLAAALATIKFMIDNRVCAHLFTVGERLRAALQQKIADHDLHEIISIHGDAPRLHVKMDDKLRPVWVKAMIDAGVLIINCNNMSWPIRQNELTLLLDAYTRSFIAIKSTLTSGINSVTPMAASLVR
jgi:glutamate-1-semialdehyde aminotransferase